MDDFGCMPTCISPDDSAFLHHMKVYILAVFMNIPSSVASNCPAALFEVLWKGRKCLKVISKCV